MIATPSSSDLPEGTKRSASTRARARSGKTFSDMRLCSPRGAGVLLGERRQRDRTEKLDLVLQRHSELLPGSPPGLGHQREGVRGAGVAGVLDEVRMPGRDLCSTDAMALQSARLEEPPGRQLMLRILEDTSVGALVGGLGSLASCLQ